MLESIGISAAQTGINAGIGLAVDNYVHDRNVKDAVLAERRAQKYWKERFDIMNDYNSPQAVAERYRQAGLNPASAFDGGAVGQALDPSVNPNNPNSTRGPQMSPFDMLGAEQSLANIELTKAQEEKVEAETKKITGEVGMQELQKSSLEMLNDFHKDEYRKLLDKLDAEIQTIKNQGDNYSASSINLMASASLLTFQGAREMFGLNLDKANYDLLVQKLETGEFQKSYWKWHADHEEALVKLAKIEGDIKDVTFEQVYESGLFGKLSEQDYENKKAEWATMQADLQKMYNLGFFPQGIGPHQTSTGKASPYYAGFGEYTTPQEGLWYYLATELI